MSYVGTSGGVAHATGLCLLSQNIINEKIYLVLWFWIVFLYILACLQFVFEMAIVFIPGFRGTLITFTMGSFSTGPMKNYIQNTCNIGDWFLLYQIGKNTDKHFFYKLIALLSGSNFNDQDEAECGKALLANQENGGESLQLNNISK